MVELEVSLTLVEVNGAIFGTFELATFTVC